MRVYVFAYLLAAVCQAFGEHQPQDFEIVTAHNVCGNNCITV